LKERQSDDLVARRVVVRLLTRTVRIEEEYQNKRSYWGGIGGFEEEEKATVSDQVRKTQSSYGSCARVSE